MRNQDNLNFTTGDHLSGSRHARRVQAAIHNMGDGYAGFLRVVATAWLPLEGEDFNTVLVTFRPRVDAVQEEPDGGEGLDVFETLEFEDPAGFIVEDYEPPPHSSGTMVRGGNRYHSLALQIVAFISCVLFQII